MDEPLAVGPGRCGEGAPAEGCIPIAAVTWRTSARFIGRVRSLRVQPWADVPTLECTVVDGTGGITLVFLGRRQVPGITLGRRMVVEGMAGAHHGKLAVVNPDYTLLAEPQ
ncbi:MAG TPA: OB-fold nucleic acid binding domain-containing protein [Acidimicrobiales bacterium]|nr:OB-fold nucleic acid binding domain-containing protein [Acidimicrobiales bacterium]